MSCWTRRPRRLQNCRFLYQKPLGTRTIASRAVSFKNQLCSPLRSSASSAVNAVDYNGGITIERADIVNHGGDTSHSSPRSPIGAPGGAAGGATTKLATSFGFSKYRRM